MPTDDEIRTQQLIEEVAKGNKDAFTSLFNNNYDRIFAIAYAYCKDTELARDVTQQVFIKTWERSNDLAAMESPLGWMCNTAKFLIINTLKQQVASRQYLDRWFERMEAMQKNPSVILDEKMLSEKIQAALMRLPERQQQVYKLSREEGLTYEQIAQQLQIGKETVKEHMARALKSIRVWLQQNDVLVWLALLLL